MSDRIVFTVTLGELAEVPGTPFAYWAPKSLRDLFQKYPPLDRDLAGVPDKPKIADLKVGLQTSDDLRFTRYWWEVPVDEIATSSEETFHGKKWVPFVKGGKPFYYDIQLVVNWRNNGEEIRNFSSAVIRNESFYFRAGLAWAEVVSQQCFDMLYLPRGSIFSTSSHAIFSFDDRILWSLLAFGNSKLAWVIFRLIDSTAHSKSVGYVAKLPVSRAILDNPTLSNFAFKAYNLLREWTTGEETATVFVKPWILQVWDAVQGTWNVHTMRPVTGHPLAHDFEWHYGPPQEVLELCRKRIQEEGFSLRTLAEACVEWKIAVHSCIEEIQRRIDDEVYRLYEITGKDRKMIEVGFSEVEDEDEDLELEEAQTKEDEEIEEEEKKTESTEKLMSVEEHIKRLIHYLAHRVIREDPDGIVPLHDCYPAGKNQLVLGLASRVRGKLKEIFGEGAMPKVELELQQILGKKLDEWLATELFGYHVGLYRRRPIVWQIVPPSNFNGSKRSRKRSSDRDLSVDFSVFIYWHKLDTDTLFKVKHVYLQPFLDAAERDVEKLEKQVIELQRNEAPRKQLNELERTLNQKRAEYSALKALSERIDELLRPHSLEVESRSEWVKEKVNEIVSSGYKPNRDYGVRVNIEPLKQRGILSKDAERVKG